jgi:hypothetical protein
MRDMADRVIEALRGVRDRAPRGDLTAWPARLVDDVIAALAPHDEHPVVASFLADCARGRAGTWDFAATRDAITAHDDAGLVLGGFSAGYNPMLALDGFSFDRVTVHEAFERAYPNTGVRPIWIRDATAGFKFELSVALFPENFVTGEAVAPRHRAYYFVDRFVRRHLEITRSVLALGTSPRAFTRLKEASDTAIARGCGTWIYLHEYFHRRGHLPLPENLGVKSTRSTAGLEEVRCDALACLAAYRGPDHGVEEGELHAELIFVERLLRYPLQDDPERNYDARGSQFLYGYLCECGALCDDGDGRIDLPHGMAGVIVALREMLIGINKLEYMEKTGHPMAGTGRRRALVERFGGFDRDARTFATLPYYESLRAALTAAGVTMRMSY